MRIYNINNQYLTHDCSTEFFHNITEPNIFFKVLATKLNVSTYIINLNDRNVIMFVSIYHENKYVLFLLEYQFPAPSVD